MGMGMTWRNFLLPCHSAFRTISSEHISFLLFLVFLITLLAFLGSVQQIKLATCQLLGLHKYSLLYRVCARVSGPT